MLNQAGLGKFLVKIVETAVFAGAAYWATSAASGPAKTSEVLGDHEKRLTRVEQSLTDENAKTDRILDILERRRK
jgi:hypothetical protein